MIVNDNELLRAIRRLNELTAGRDTIIIDQEIEARIRERTTLSRLVGTELVRRNEPFVDSATKDEWWPSDTPDYPVCLRWSWRTGSDWCRETVEERSRSLLALKNMRAAQRAASASPPDFGRRRA